jgi:esterase/lipase superfamily enzyme
MAHSRPRILAVLACLTVCELSLICQAFPYVAAQEAPSRQLNVPPAGRAKSDSFPLADSEELLLRIDNATTVPLTTIPSLQLYVHQEDSVLLHKGEASDGQLVWRPLQAGRYYVVVDNPGATAATVNVSVRAATGKVRGGPGANYATVRLGFVTNRQQTGTTPSTFFGGDPSTELTYGQADITIPRDHRLGELEGPSIWRLELRANPDRHVVLTSVRPSAKTRFLADTRGRVAIGTTKQVLLFVHGFNVTFQDAMRRAGQLVYDLAFDGAPVVYSWPSQGSLLPLAYTKDQRNADLSAAALREVLMDLAGLEGAVVHVIAHSMGNKVLADALADMGAPQRGGKPVLGELALVAPDIDAELFRQAARRLAPTATRLTLYASSADGAMIAAQRVAGYKRAGQAGQDILVLPGIDTIDATDVDTSLLGVSHSYYADNTTILSDIFSLLRGRRPEDRFNLVAVSAGSGQYWRFRPAAR